jgi:pimeloyl-ACP methyl ester carboxylesterase
MKLRMHRSQVPRPRTRCPYYKEPSARKLQAQVRLSYTTVNKHKYGGLTMVRICFVAFCLSLLAGCQSFAVPIQHVVMFDRTGEAVDPTGNAGEDRHSTLLSYRRYETHEYDEHINRIITGIKQWGSKPQGNQAGKRKLMFFIHGGMNTQVGSLKRLTDPFEDDKTRVDLIKEAGYYPIFINWKSSLWSSYFEHLWETRQGERWPWYAGIPSALIIFPIDVTRSLVRAPLVWGQLVYNDFQTINNAGNQFGPSLGDSVSAELLCRYNLEGPMSKCVDSVKFQKPPYCVPFAIEATPMAFRPSTRVPPADNTFPIAVGSDERRCTEMNLRFFSYAITFPIKLAVAPVLDTFGTSAWINMQRRIHLLFHSDDEMQSSPITESARWRYELAHIPASGGLSRFIEHLLEAKKKDAGYEWEIVLVGHSMGAIILNELIQLYGEKLPIITDIVYLAAAASIEDYEDSLFPYLSAHSETQFYNFMLHPIVERGEIQYDMADVPPRGSLLTWLDTFLANPETLLHRRVGRYDNYLRALHDTPTCTPSLCIRNRIHVRSFSAGVDEANKNPQSHSEMAERFRFWEPKCWKVDAPLEECVQDD